MTTIKPPTAGPTVPNTHSEASVSAGAETPADASGGAARTEHAASSASEFSRGTDQANALSATGAAGQAAADPIAQLARAVESGSLSLDTAVDNLLSQTLARAERHLTADQLSELSGLLRDALLSDPTLTGMRSQRS